MGNFPKRRRNSIGGGDDDDLKKRINQMITETTTLTQQVMEKIPVGSQGVSSKDGVISGIMRGTMNPRTSHGSLLNGFTREGDNDGDLSESDDEDDE